MAAEDVRLDTVLCSSDRIDVGGGTGGINGGGGIVRGRSRMRWSLRNETSVGKCRDLELLPTMTLSEVCCSSMTDGGVRVLVDADGDAVDNIDLTL